MDKFKKISVITPTFNQGSYIEKTINSVLSQNYPNLEYIIIDGGSTDNTVDIIKKYEKHLTYWVSEPDRGQSHAINKGMSLATGDILTWLNSDDWYMPGALKHFSVLFNENPDAGMVVGSGRIVDENNKEVVYTTPPAHIDFEHLLNWQQGNHFVQPASAFSKLAWQKAGPLDETVHIVMDLDLWLNMAKNGVKFISTEKLLAEALSHPNAKTTAFVNLMDLDCALNIIKHGGQKEGELILTKMINRLSWYDRNYQIIITHPLIKLLRPLIKVLANNSDGYWNGSIPPWIKQ